MLLLALLISANQLFVAARSLAEGGVGGAGSCSAIKDIITVADHNHRELPTAAKGDLLVLILILFSAN